MLRPSFFLLANDQLDSLTGDDEEEEADVVGAGVCVSVAGVAGG